MDIEITRDATLAGRPVSRIGFGAMQLAGPGVFGPPADPDGARAVLRRVVELGINHIDTSDFYGPHVVNELIADTLHPYPDDLVLVTKVGARRDSEGAWLPALSPDELRSAVHDNLRRLKVDRLDVVNLRMHGLEGPEEGPIEAQATALAELREQGLVQHIGLSNVTTTQLAAAQAIAPVVCVQNLYNVAQHGDDPMVDLCHQQGIGYVPFFPLGGFQPLQEQALHTVAQRHGATDRQIALAWLLHRSPAILLIPGTSSVAHLEQNSAVGSITLTEQDLSDLTL